MELREAINKLFEMTDEQRLEIFDFSDVEEVLNSYIMGTILVLIEEFYSNPKYGDIYLDKNGDKLIVLDGDFALYEKCKTPQSMPFDYIERAFTKTGKNVANELKNLFK